MHKEAVTLDPLFRWAYAGEENNLVILGEEEEAWQAGQAAPVNRNNSSQCGRNCPSQKVVQRPNSCTGSYLTVHRQPDR
jgi:hypothetical protein